MIGYLPYSGRRLFPYVRNVEEDGTVTDAFSTRHIEDRTGRSTNGSTIEHTDRRENTPFYKYARTRLKTIIILVVGKVITD